MFLWDLQKVLLLSHEGCRMKMEGPHERKVENKKTKCNFEKTVTIISSKDHDTADTDEVQILFL